ncbi:cupin domain-containing protein [Candidatus Nomurabacteria bacterium]|nr:cupin domain-containing protein [Candidatus Nomurabacteria bacterium]
MESKLIKIRKVDPAFCDERGCITDVIDKPVGHIGHITFTKGALRAKHYHKESTQYDFILTGKIRLIVCLPDGSEREDHVLNAGMATEVPPGIVHTYVAEEESSMIDITTLSREDNGYEEDTIRVDLDLS